MDASPKFAVIFDMDGVLIDSPKYNWEAINKVLNPKGFNFEGVPPGRYIGRSLKDQVALWKEELNIDIGDFDEFRVAINKGSWFRHSLMVCREMFKASATALSLWPVSKSSMARSCSIEICRVLSGFV